MRCRCGQKCHGTDTATLHLWYWCSACRGWSRWPTRWELLIDRLTHVEAMVFEIVAALEAAHD